MKPTSIIKKCILLVVAMATLASVAVAAPLKVAILPFTIHSDKDYTFLQKGIVEMLSSRLSAPGQVDIIDPQSTTQALGQVQGMSGDNLALLVGAKLKADFIVHGSVTSLGDNVSLDAKMLDITGQRPPLTFFKQTQGMGEVIPQVNLLATDINTQVFGRQAQSAPTPATVASPVASGSVPAGDIHAHPEKLLQDGQIAAERPAGFNPLAGGAAATPNTVNPAFVNSPGSSADAPQFWKSQNLPLLINGIGVEDVNRDGQQELVVVAANKVLIYQTVQGRMRQIAEIGAPSFTVNIAADVGDFDRDGTPEIFVTAYGTGQETMNSYVLEYDGSEFKIAHDNLPWYFRLLRSSERGLVLLGQRQISGESPSYSPVMELEYNGTDYLQGKIVVPGKKVNVLGLNMGNLMGKDGEVVIAFDDGDKLRVLESNGQDIWKAGEPYGGSTVAFNLVSENTSPEMAGMRKPIYLPVRVLLADLDKNGTPEVIVPQNIDMANRRMALQRFFKKGKIVSLSWDGLGLFPIWQTRELNGRIQDLCIADVDNDGTLELIAAVVTKEGAIAFTDAQSSIIAYDLTLK